MKEIEGFTVKELIKTLQKLPEEYMESEVVAIGISISFVQSGKRKEILELTLMNGPIVK